MLSRTLRCGKSAPSCGTIPTRRFSGGTKTSAPPLSVPATVRSPNRTTPASGRMKPARILSSVVLPDPLAPRTAATVPEATSRSIPSSTRTGP